MPSKEYNKANSKKCAKIRKDLKYPNLFDDYAKFIVPILTYPPPSFLEKMVCYLKKISTNFEILKKVC